MHATPDFDDLIAPRHTDDEQDDLSIDVLAEMDPQEFARHMIGRPMEAHRVAIQWAETRAARHDTATPMALMAAFSSWLLTFIEIPSMIDPIDPRDLMDGGGF